jgi:hypothetical protein
VSRCSPSSIIAIFHTTGIFSLPQNKIRAGKLLIDPGHLQEERLVGRPHFRYRRARHHRPVVDRALQKKKHKLLMAMAKNDLKQCSLPLYLLSDLPPLPKLNVQYIRTVCSCGGVGVLNCTVDHILQEFYTLFLTRFWNLQNCFTAPNKVTSKDDTKGLVS